MSSVPMEQSGQEHDIELGTSPTVSNPTESRPALNPPESGSATTTSEDDKNKIPKIKAANSMYAFHRLDLDGGHEMLERLNSRLAAIGPEMWATQFNPVFEWDPSSVHVLPGIHGRYLAVLLNKLLLMLVMDAASKLDTPDLKSVVAVTGHAEGSPWENNHLDSAYASEYRRIGRMDIVDWFSHFVAWSTYMWKRYVIGGGQEPTVMYIGPASIGIATKILFIPVVLLLFYLQAGVVFFGNVSLVFAMVVGIVLQIGVAVYAVTLGRNYGTVMVFLLGYGTLNTSLLSNWYRA